MITPAGEIQVLEFNCRFGDPETQAILPLLATPLVDLMTACVEQRLADLLPIEWSKAVATCVVMAAGGYPGDYQKGQPISIGSPTADATIFQAGTTLQDGQLVTDGGRVLGVTALGANFQESIDRAYEAVGTVQFEGMYYRRDIGQRALSTIR
jgi:phosphoribosylamine--glycine ligase